VRTFVSRFRRSFQDSEYTGARGRLSSLPAESARFRRSMEEAKIKTRQHPPRRQTFLADLLFLVARLVGDSLS
jgi:hypothetical protein